MTTRTRQPHPPRLGLRLGGFITASLAAHWLVLAGWTEPESISPAITPLAVQLLPSPVKESRHEVRAEPLVEQNRAQRAPAQPLAPTATEQVTANATETAAPQPEPTAITTTKTAVAWAESRIEPNIEQSKAQVPQTLKTVSLAEAQESIRNRLKDDLTRRFKYPHLARLRSWEGTVVLDLQIETNGKISRITLAQSSGYALLDDNAIATLNRIGRVSSVQQWLEGGNMELQLPVIYRLSDS